MAHTTNIPAVAGIDVGKYFLDLDFFPAAKPLHQDNTEAGITKLISTLTQRGIHKVALEAMGCYVYPLIAALRKAGFDVAVADPRQDKAFRSAERLIAKTDRLDGIGIASFLILLANPSVWLAR